METTVIKHTYIYRRLKGLHDNDITALSFHPIQTHKLVSSSLDRTLVLWRIDNFNNRRFRAHTSGVLDVCYSPDGDLIATTSTDQSIRIWDPEDHINFTEYKAHYSAVRSVQFNPKGDKFVSASNDENVILWTPCRKKYCKKFSGHTSSVRCAKFSPDGKLLVSCSDDKTIKVWDIISGQCVKTFTNTRVPARYVEFHPTGTFIGTANEDGCIKLCDLRTDSYQGYSVHDAGVNMIRFNPNGNFMLTASDDCTMKILDLLNGRPIYTLREHYDKVTCIAFSNDGKLFASGSLDRRILVWKYNDLCMDDRSRENSTQQLIPSITENRNLMMPSSVKHMYEKFNDGNEKSNSDKHMYEKCNYMDENPKRGEKEEDKEDLHKTQVLENYLSNFFEELHSESDSAGLLAKIVEPKNIADVKSSQKDYTKYMPIFSIQPRSSKQSETVSKDRTSFNTLSSNQSIKTEADQVVKQIQSLRHYYDALEQRLTILEKKFMKLGR